MPSQPTAYSTGPSFVVRVAGMPIDVLDRLRVGRTLALIGQVLDIEQWLDERRDRLCDELHGLIGGNDDTVSRRRLISLRRDVYLGRLPRTGMPDAASLPVLSRHLAADLEQWYLRVARRRDLLASAATELATESQEVRCALKDITADTNLLQALVLASPSLYATLATGPRRRPARTARSPAPARAGGRAASRPCAARRPRPWRRGAASWSSTR